MTFEMIAGIVLLVINIPLGWFGMVWLGYYGKKTGKKIYYFLSAAVYVLSWIMMAGGFYLCGKDYASYIICNVKHYVYPLVILLIAVFIIVIAVQKNKEKR
ncbi:MAG: hypothetical protein WC234_00340 [Endomicrobiaceae bacterium]